MSVFGDVLLALAGIALIGAVFDSAMRTFVLPRGVVSPLTRTTFVSLRAFFNLLVRGTKTYEGRDSVMALYGPIGLFGLVLVWMVMVIGGYTLILKGATTSSWVTAFELSGSSFFTLGFVRPPGGAPGYAIAFSEAAVGLGILALLIAYLPTIYGAFSRREVEVNRLTTLAGTPPSGVELLGRYSAINWNDKLPELWAVWEAWFAELAETHTSLGVLSFFRSPNPHRSWVTASGAILDAASLAQSTLAIPWSPQAGLCIRSGSLALREIATYYDIGFDPDPPPDGAISIARSEFIEAYEQLGAAGAPIRPDRERAWRDFAGWRVNYDTPLIGLATLTMAPYAPWSSDRSLAYRRPRFVRRRGSSAPR